MTKNELLALEKQLSCPNGERGVEVGEQMNRSNRSMTEDTIAFLNLADQQRVLELGHGNAGHLSKLLDTTMVQYYGLEISAVMFSEAKRINENLPAQFQLYDGLNIPYPEDTFDSIFSVNTIYFWQNPVGLLKEIERVLAPKGSCVLTYANKDFMRKLPFVQQLFQLYDKASIKDIIQNTNLKIQAVQQQTAPAISKTGERLNRSYTMVKLVQ